MREIFRIKYNFFNHLLFADFKSFSKFVGDFTYYLPDSFADGQFHGILTNILEESPYCFVIGETPTIGEYVVLDECDGRMGYLCGKVSGLTFAKSEILLAVLEYDFDRPSHGINFISLGKLNVSVSGNYAAPWCVDSAAHIENPHRDIVDKSIDSNKLASVNTAGFKAALPGGIFGYQGLRRIFIVVSITVKRKAQGFFSHLNHAEIVAPNAARLDKTENLLADEPAVSQHIVKTVSVPDGSFYHFLEKFNLTFGVVLNTLCRCRFSITLFLVIPAGNFLLSHGVIAVLAGFPNQLTVYDHLAASVADCKDKGLEPKNHLMGNMAENPTDFFRTQTTFRIICVINYDTYGKAGVVGTVADPLPKLFCNVVHYSPPVKTIVVQKTIEHIFGCAA